MVFAGLYIAVICLTASGGASPSLNDLFRRADGDPCSVQPANPAPPPSVVCGLRGSLSKASQIGGATSAGTVERCVARCQANPSCQSFGFNDNGACRLYSKKVKQQGFQQDPSSATRYWRNKCWTCSCGSGETNCNGTCFDLESNANHCGQCSFACPANSLCLVGSCTCQPQCSGGQVCDLGICNCPSNNPDLCNAQCTNVNGGDAQNCGSCGNACVSGAECISQGGQGQCQCGQGLDYCDNNGQPACFDLQTDQNNCGTCGNKCGDNFSCQNGQCTCSGSCLSLCGSSCINTCTDSNNCGFCGNQCSGNLRCNSGACTCNDPDFNCLKVCNGQCTDICSTNDNCAVCGGTCPPNTHCYFAGCINN